MPSGSPAEFGESSLIASIIIESERVISVRNKSSSRVVCERKNVTGSLITEVCLGLVNTLLNWFTNKQHISYLLSVNVLFSGLSSGPTSCLQILYLLAYLKKCLGSTLIFRYVIQPAIMDSRDSLKLLVHGMGLLSLKLSHRILILYSAGPF